jgi:4'-phosphopantetheinyl transferase
MSPAVGINILNKTPDRIKLNPDTVHLWAARLSQWKTKLNEMDSFLDPAERIRADRFIIPERRVDFITQRGFLRTILSKYLVHKPGEITISISEDGKPFLVEGNINFNLSHSEDLMICGITSGARIGVDIQHIYPVENLDRIIPKILTPAEIKLIENSPQKDKNELFLTIWTAKEAFLKALGSGFNSPVYNINISSIKENTLTLGIDDPRYGSKWNIQELAIEPGYKAVLAIEGSDIEIKIISITPDIL